MCHSFNAYMKIRLYSHGFPTTQVPYQKIPMAIHFKRMRNVLSFNGHIQTENRHVSSHVPWDLSPNLSLPSLQSIKIYEQSAKEPETFDKPAVQLC